MRFSVPLTGQNQPAGRQGESKSNLVVWAVIRRVDVFSILRHDIWAEQEVGITNVENPVQLSSIDYDDYYDGWDKWSDRRAT